MGVDCEVYLPPAIRAKAKKEIESYGVSFDRVLKEGQMRITQFYDCIIKWGGHEWFFYKTKSGSWRYDGHGCGVGV